MTDGKQISVAELLARNGQQNGAQNGGGRRRRAGKSGGVSVASLTGEFPVVQPVENPQPAPAAPQQQPVPSPAAPPPTPRQPALFQRTPVQPPTSGPQPMVQQPIAQPQPVVPQQPNIAVPQQLSQPTVQRQSPVVAPGFPIQPPAVAPTVRPTVSVQPYDFAEPAAVAATPAVVAATPAAVIETPPEKPAKRRTRAERRAAEERERAEREAAATPVSHGRPEVGEPVAEQPTDRSPQDFPTVVDQPAATGIAPPAVNTMGPPAPNNNVIAPAPSSMAAPAQSGMVPPPDSIPGLKPATFDPVGQTYAPSGDAEAMAPHPVVGAKPSRQSKLRSFPLGRFSATAQRTDEAPTEIRQPDPVAMQCEDENESPQAAPQPADDDMGATSVWPAPAIGVGGARALKIDEVMPDLSAMADSGRATAEPKVRKDKPRKPKKQAQRVAAAVDFPTTIWNTSNQESQLTANPTLAGELLREDAPPLLAGPSLAGELMRGAAEEPFELTEHYHNPQPDDQPTDVDHPFFSRGGVDFDAPLEVGDIDESAQGQGMLKRAWWIQVGQWLAAGVCGVLLFKGFEVLWVHLAMVALALAVTVILGLVALVRILRRTDDVLSLAIAVVVGVFVTLGPLAFTLRTG